MLFPSPQRILVDPVLLEDGRTYNGWILRTWLKIINRSPCTDQVIKEESLVPAILIRCLVYQQILT